MKKKLFNEYNRLCNEIRPKLKEVVSFKNKTEKKLLIKTR